MTRIPLLLTFLALAAGGCTRQGSDPGVPVELEFTGRLLGGDRPEVEFEVRNTGASMAYFWGYGPEAPQTWRERQVEGTWEEVAWDWCGAGLELQRLGPGKSFVFRASADPGQTMRIGSRFAASRNGEFLTHWSNPVPCPAE